MSARKAIRILSVCDDDGIRFSRELVLRQEGYEVESMAGSEPIDAARARSFHIAILCHSLSPRHATQITDHLRQANPGIRVLRVHALRSATDHYYDADCEVLPGPGQLLSGIRMLSAQFQRPVPRGGESKRA